MNERYRCSQAALDIWGRLRSTWARALDGDTDERGINWAERAEISSEIGGGLDTASRLLFCDSVSALRRLATQGRSQTLGVLLAHRRLCGKSMWETRKKYKLDKDTADEYLAGVKEYLAWALSDDPDAEPPDLPFAHTLDTSTVR